MQVICAYSREVFCKGYWHVHLAMQMQTFCGVHLNIDSSHCLPSPGKDTQISAVQSLTGAGLFLSIH